MTMPKLTLGDLASGLLQFEGEYFALDVFASDVDELTDNAKFSSAGLSQGPDGSFNFERVGRHFNLTVFSGLDVARVTLIKPPSATVPAAALTGGLLGAATAKRGSEVGGAAIGFLAGLLVGAAIGQPTPSAPRRVFTLKFDPDTQEWRPYDGGLVRWVKGQLGPPEVVGDLPARG
jgi:hypothetical protein